MNKKGIPSMSFLVGLIISLLLIGILITFSTKIFLPDNSAKEAEKFNNVVKITEDLAKKNTGKASELIYLNKDSLMVFFTKNVQYTKVYYATNKDEGLIARTLKIRNLINPKAGILELGVGIVNHIEDFVRVEVMNVDLEKEKDEQMIETKWLTKILEVIGAKPPSLTVYRSQYCDESKACVCLCTDLDEANIVKTIKDGSFLYELMGNNPSYNTQLKCSEDPKKTTCYDIEGEVLFASNYGTVRSLKKSYENNIKGGTVTRGYYIRSEDGVIIENGVTGVPMNIQTPVFLMKENDIIFVCPFASTQKECVLEKSYYYDNEKMRAKIAGAANEFALTLKKCSTNTKDDAACEGALPALNKVFDLENELGTQVLLVTNNKATNGEYSLQGSAADVFTPFLVRKTYVDIGTQRYLDLAKQAIIWFGPIGSEMVADQVSKRLESVAGSAMYEFWAKTAPIITIKEEADGVYSVNTGNNLNIDCTKNTIAGYQYTLWRYDDKIMLNKDCVVEKILYTDGTLGFVVTDAPSTLEKAWTALTTIATVAVTVVTPVVLP